MKIDVTKYNEESIRFAPKEKKEAFWNRDISFSPKKLKDTLKERFYNNFLTLLKAGIDVQNTLEILSAEKKTNNYLKTIQQIKTQLIKGKTLSESIESTGEFSNYEVNSIKIGEETGHLLLILEQLNQFFYGKIKLKKLLIKAITYPLFILFITIGVLVFMLNYVVPMFKDVFARFDKELPALTQKILGLSEFLQHYFLYLLIGFIGVIIWFYFQRKKIWFRKIFSQISLRIPFFGGLIKQIYLARFYQFMYLLTNAKHNLVDSIRLVHAVIGFYPIEKALEKTEEDLRKGENLHISLSKSGFFDTRLITLIKVAENSNQLDSMFEKLSVQEQETLEIKTETMGSIIEPIMIIIIGILVAVILVAMYIPLFNLGTLLD